MEASPAKAFIMIMIEAWVPINFSKPLAAIGPGEYQLTADGATAPNYTRARSL